MVSSDLRGGSIVRILVVDGSQLINFAASDFS
jgi:hypothetical protein